MATTAPPATSSARGSGRGGSFIHTSALRLCATFFHGSNDAIVDTRRPVSLFFRLVPYNRLKTPVYHQVRAANSATPAASTAAEVAAEASRTRRPPGASALSRVHVDRRRG